MTITAAELAQIYPACSDPELYAGLLSEAWQEFGLDSRNARAGFLGIIGGETGGQLQVKRENMMYSPSRGNAVFGARGRKCAVLAPLDDAGKVVRDDKGRAYASCVYENMYGNGPRETEDGWNYRGGGMIGWTFKELYAKGSKALGVDFLNNPDLLGEPRNSVRAAVWFVTKLKPQCHKLLQAEDEGSYMQACLMVGNNADEAARQRRLDFRRAALKVVRPAGTKRDPETGNVTIKDIKDSTIVKDSNQGGIIAGGGAVASGAGVAQAMLSADWKTAAVFAAFVVVAGALAFYFLKIRKARKQMHADGIV